jgi:hypothetical protein
VSQIRHLVLSLLGIVVIAAPLSIVTAILLLPLWRWLEASTGIESVGHSGPAEWCYAAVFVVLVAGASLVALIRYRVRASRTHAA